MTPFGTYLERLRKQRRVTQSQLAEVLGVTPGYISAIENGRKVPSSESLLIDISKNLQLTRTEHEQLLIAHGKSKFLWRVPEEIQTEEYELVSELWSHLGSLSLEKIELIKLLLNLRQEPPIGFIERLE